jgi:P27 family predicted phage terminase small subunit
MAKITKISDEKKKIQGTDRYIKNVPEAKPITALWKTPAGLSKAAQAFYKETGALLINAKVLTPLDRILFQQLPVLYDHLLKLEALLKKEGFTAGGADYIKKHPAANARKEIFNDFVRICEKFGLSPYDRNRLNLPVDKEPEDQSRKFLFAKHKK